MADNTPKLWRDAEWRKLWSELTAVIRTPTGDLVPEDDIDAEWLNWGEARSCHPKIESFTPQSMFWRNMKKLADLHVQVPVELRALSGVEAAPFCASKDAEPCQGCSLPGQRSPRMVEGGGFCSDCKALVGT